MTRFSRWLVVIFITQCLYQTAHGQKYLDDLGDIIEPQVESLYGGRFELHLIMLIDSSLTKRQTFPSGPIQDPYGSLHGCSIFTASSKEWGFVGVFKNGQIIWHSDTIINVRNSYRHSILSTMDLNNDSKVDIVTSWSYGMDGGQEGLWIFSWDGQTGVSINDYDMENVSTVIADGGLFRLVDVNADGVFEIQGTINVGTPEERIVTYAWNGQKYGNWPGGPQPPTKGYLPKNRVDVDVKSEVRKKSNGELYVYHYSLENKATSAQGVESLMLEEHTNLVIATATPKGWYFCPPRRNLCGWSDDASDPRPIDKSIIETRFQCESVGLPALVSYFVQGRNPWHGEPGIDKITLEFPEEAWYYDMVSNSSHGMAIGPSDPPNSFLPTMFLDTLISYKHQSMALGWIDNEGVANSLDQKLENARMKLEDRDSVAAGNILQAFVNEVEAQKDKHLSSEAYALLKFNAEYLIDRLRSSGKPEGVQEKK